MIWSGREEASRKAVGWSRQDQPSRRDAQASVEASAIRQLRTVSDGINGELLTWGELKRCCRDTAREVRCAAGVWSEESGRRKCRRRREEQ